MSQKPSIPSGTRDFSPVIMARRNYIFNTITDVYKKSGYKQIETPAMEKLSTLTGKYGEEGDNLIYKIVNSGDFLKKVSSENLSEISSNQMLPKIAEKGLRYDLTVPFARFVVQHRNDLTFPFKRFQIQPVWRADRPQAGRYREFYQCDADVIGSRSLLNEVELVRIIDEVFQKLDLNVTIKLNNRKLLTAIAEKIGHEEKLIDITVALDKLDKIGYEKVLEEFVRIGIDQDSIDMLEIFINLTDKDFLEKINFLRELFSDLESGTKGVEEIEEVYTLLTTLKIKNKVDFDLTLARGLNYYTGTIIEVAADDLSIGSICGGGRYDDLTGIFGLKDVSGVGISFGADRIYDVLSQLDKFPEDTIASTKAIFVNFGEAEEKYILPILQELLNSGISAEIYPDRAKMKKQMSYANSNNIPFVLLAGDKEIEQKSVTVKNMLSGEQTLVAIDDLLNYLQEN